MKRLTILLAFCLTLLPIRAQLLDDIISGKYRAKTLPSYVSTADGEYMVRLQNGVITKTPYKPQKNQAIDTIFNIADTKLLKLDKVEGFIMPDNGKYLLVYNNAQRIYRRSFKADWYIYNTERKELKPLSDNMPVSSPVFSPNGRYIAFSRDNNLYIHKLDFSTEVAVTTDGAVGKIINGTPDWLYEEEFSTTCLFAFSPDSKQLAFVRLDESQVKQFCWQEFLTDNYPTNYSLKYPKAGEENAKAAVVIYDTQYKTLKTINLEENQTGYIPRLRFVADERLAIFTLNRNQNKLKMYAVNPKSTVTELIYEEQSSDSFIDFELIDQWQFLENGNIIVVNNTNDYQQAYLYSQHGQLIRQLTKGQFDITRVYGYDPTTLTLFYQAAYPDPMSRQLFALNTKNNKTIQLSREEGTHNATFSKNMAYYIDNYQSLTHANSYTICNNKGTALKQLLSNQTVEEAFLSLNLPKKQFIKIPTPRGDTLNAWLLLPSDFNPQNKYPVLQVQYSGPQSQQVLNTWRIDWEYFLASQGIIVVCADGRGTGARGKQWCNSTYMNLGQKEAEDQVAVAQYMQTLSYVKPDKIGIWGWSFGGYMTLRAMSEPQAVFCCGIAVAPVTDWRLYDSSYTERFMRRPQENESGYDNASVITRAKDLNGRLLICHGLADDNVHCQQTWKYIEALVQAGVQFDMQIYPDDNHFLRKRKNYQHLYHRKWEFLKTNLLE